MTTCFLESLTSQRRATFLEAHKGRIVHIVSLSLINMFNNSQNLCIANTTILENVVACIYVYPFPYFGICLFLSVDLKVLSKTKKIFGWNTWSLDENRNQDVLSREEEFYLFGDQVALECSPDCNRNDNYFVLVKQLNGFQQG
jgi:hypothetical protein